ncbi:type II toxin-antitoxin system CcdA family antitoxin [Trichlorobacter lovleyi]|uniref:type II toxin-antitoxin system CcdA family antitoxin n=1 Tax=Trichlorobacter lovleyi TaxID=313985 RepID=UPI002480A6FB|nr:type II toxin-antitoxin system CcdA family antitoxin [Trichlorobacter lovleyi]
MQPAFYDTNAPKKPTNVSINRDLLLQAKEHQINLSQALENRLAELLREQKQQQWLRDNQDAVEAYNQRIAQNGLFSDGQRKF